MRETPMLVRKDINQAKTASGYFNQIAVAALEQDQDEIDSLLSKDYFTLDIKWGFGFGHLTPAGFHELKGDTKAAEFLMKNGADVDYMAFGAALRGDMTRADILRTRHGANPSIIARGAAYSGYQRYAEWLVLFRGANPLDVVLGLISAKEYADAKKFITTFGVSLRLGRETDFWQTVGMTEGVLTPELKEIYVLLDGNYIDDKNEENYKKYQVALGAGLSGNYELSKDADDTTKKGFYHGAIRGGYSNDVPDSCYQPKPLAADIPIHFDLNDAVSGCNIDFLERCYEENKSTRAARVTFLRWLYFKTLESNDLQLIRCVPQRSNLITELFKYGGELTDFSTIYSRNLTFKTLSFVFKTRNSNIINHLDAYDFLDYLPNADIARHLLAFDDNIAFHQKLLDRFDTFKWDGFLLRNKKYDLSLVISEANKIRTFMQKYKFNYDQALAFIKSADLRNFLFNTCKDVTMQIDRDICSIIVSNLATIGKSDAADLIAKIRYYRHTIQDILHIADDFKNYAATHVSEQSTHAASIANALAQSRKNEVVVDVLAHEMQLLQTAKAESSQPSQPLYSSLMKSAAGLFNTAKSLLVNDQTPAHLKSYQNKITDDGYETLVTNSMAAINTKLNH
jgi:hypothetical protein